MRAGGRAPHRRPRAATFPSTTVGPGVRVPPRAPSGWADRSSSSSSLHFQPALEAVRHGGEGPVALPQGRDTRGPQRIELPAAAAPLRGGIADPGLEEALVL